MATDVAIVVLGFPSRRDGRPHPVQRWRVRRALEVVEQYSPDTVVFTGGSRKGGPSEASAMASLAVDLGLDEALVVLEERATTTWENVEFARRLTGRAASVLLVSDRRHATRARGYWLQQSVGDAERVVVAVGNPGRDGWWMQPFFLADFVGKAVLDRVRPSMSKTPR